MDCASTIDPLAAARFDDEYRRERLSTRKVEGGEGKGDGKGAATEGAEENGSRSQS